MEAYKIPIEMKVTLYTVVGTFLVFLFIGMLVKNPAGVIIVRAFISAFLFGGLLYAVFFLLKRYIPDFWDEMLSLPEAGVKVEKRGEAESHVGKNVDYVLADDGVDSVSGEGKEALREKESVVTEKESEDFEGDQSLSSVEGDTTEEDESEKEADSEDELPTLESLFEDEEEQEAGKSSGPAGSDFKKASVREGSYISVGDAKIPYEPEALAKAVKKVMREDEQ